MGPAANEGVPGNVYWLPYSARCYVRGTPGWSEVRGLVNIDAVAAATSYTIDPGAGHDRPPQSWLEMSASAKLCNAISVPFYGTKRLWRLRELVAAGAFERMPGDPSPLSLSEISNRESGINHPASHACNVNTHDGVAVGGFRSGDELARDTAISLDSLEQTQAFVIGSVATSNCVSRYGVQDLIGNMWEMASDRFASCGPGIPCVGIQSDVDAGNNDLEGFALDGNAGAGPDIGQVTLESQAKVLVPLAMPLVAAAPYGTTPDPAQLRGDTFAVFSMTLTQPRAGLVGGDFDRTMTTGRFSTDFGGTPDGSGVDATYGMRCVVAAVPR
jgi:hypothetical protein